MWVNYYKPVDVGHIYINAIYYVYDVDTSI